MSLNDLLSKARRRELIRIAANESTLALAIATAGLILLLLVGTQVLDWYWLALLAGVSLSFALYRLRQRVPDQYVLAQRIDRRLKLSDALSTAVYFSEHPRRDLQPVCDLQRRKAEEVAREVDPRQAVPFVRPRHILPALIMAIAALGLFGVRYLVTGTMSLQPSLVKIAYESFFGTKVAEAKNVSPRARFDPKAGDSPDVNPLLDAYAPQDLSSPDNPNGNAQASDDKEAGKDAANPSDDSRDPGKQDPQGDPSGPGKNQPDSNQQQPNDSKDSQKKGQDPQNGGSANSSLMDKLRDALANMMNKMKSTMDGEKQQAKNSQKGGQGEKQQSAEKGDQAKESQQAQPDINGDTQSQQGDQQNSADAQKGQKSAPKNASQDAKNGVGSQDGEKAMREAEQLQAMGKITEIFGKRSANVAGEVMMEVASGKQQIKTEWSQQQAKHAEAGSEIHRDEVPLIYQPFVQQYFEEIRKPQPSAAKPSAKASPKSETSKSGP
ncbi:MAG TPA: hypothetical protein VKV74_05515 [Bryobacteraceae bacterium]|nr:hypothetical protein [Bryobacteraceae bacterium]